MPDSLPHHCHPHHGVTPDIQVQVNGSIRINSIQSFRSNFWKPDWSWHGRIPYLCHLKKKRTVTALNLLDMHRTGHIWAYLGMGFTVTICNSLGIPALQHWSDPTLLQDFAEFGSRPGATRAKHVPDWEKPFPSNGPMASIAKSDQVRPSPFWFGKIRQCNPDLLPVSPRHDSCFIHLHTGTSPLAQSVFSQPPRYEPYRPPSHRESAVDLADFWRYPGSTSFGVNYLFDVQVFVWSCCSCYRFVGVSWKVRDVRWC